MDPRYRLASFRRFGARIRGRAKKSTKMAKLNKTLNKTVAPGIGVLAFMATVGPGDRAGKTGMNALKATIASAITRVSGGYINAFQMMGVSTRQPVTMYSSPLNWNKLWNPWTWGGALLTLYGHFSPYGPYRTFAKKAGKASFVGGLLGSAISGLTGDPAPANPANSRSGPMQALPIYAQATGGTSGSGPQ